MVYLKVAILLRIKIVPLTNDFLWFRFSTLFSITETTSCASFFGSHKTMYIDPTLTFVLGYFKSLLICILYVSCTYLSIFTDRWSCDHFTQLVSCMEQDMLTFLKHSSCLRYPIECQAMYFLCLKIQLLQKHFYMETVCHTWSCDKVAIHVKIVLSFVLYIYKGWLIDCCLICMTRASLHTINHTDKRKH